jgi:hypothetical protein
MFMMFIMKKLLSAGALFLAFFFMCAPLAAAGPDDPQDVNGEYYAISTAAQFKKFRDWINYNNETYADKTYRLTADICLSGDHWEPIGQIKTTPFKGAFDGNGHKVSSFDIIAENYGGAVEEMPAGLFGVVTGGNIFNLGVTDFVISVDRTGCAVESVSNKIYAGGLVGFFDTEDVTYNSAITNSYATGSVLASSYGKTRVGGLVGGVLDDYSGIPVLKITNSYATGSVSLFLPPGSIGGIKAWESGYAGGLVGSLGFGGPHEIENSYATGSVFAYSASPLGANSPLAVGGLVGSMNYASAHKITNSYATGGVSASSALCNVYAGGFVGLMQAGTIGNSYATGRVSASSDSETSMVCRGGFVGLGNWANKNFFDRQGAAYQIDSVNGRDNEGMFEHFFGPDQEKFWIYQDLYYPQIAALASPATAELDIRQASAFSVVPVRFASADSFVNEDRSDHVAHPICLPKTTARFVLENNEFSILPVTWTWDPPKALLKRDLGDTWLVTPISEDNKDIDFDSIVLKASSTLSSGIEITKIFPLSFDIVSFDLKSPGDPSDSIPKPPIIIDPTPDDDEDDDIPAEEQPGEGDLLYYVTLPHGSDISKVRIKIDLPEGSTISPPIESDSLWDFTNGPHKFILTLQDGNKLNITVEIIVLPSNTRERQLATPDGTKWTMTGRRRSDGSFAVTVDAPLLGEEGEQTNYPSRIYVHLPGISGARVSIEPGGYSSGDVPATEPCLRMSYAANIAQMELFEVYRIYFTYDDEPGIMYVQKFNPSIVFTMLNRDIDLVPGEEDEEDEEEEEEEEEEAAAAADNRIAVLESGAGCDAGFGAAHAFALLAAFAAIGRRRA